MVSPNMKGPMWFSFLTVNCFCQHWPLEQWEGSVRALWQSCFSCCIPMWERAWHGTETVVAEQECAHSPQAFACYAL